MLRKCRSQTQWITFSLPKPDRSEHSYPLMAEAAYDEAHDPRGGHVQPLQVIESQQCRAGFGEGTKGGKCSQRYGPLIGRWKGCVRQKEGSLERLPLRIGKFCDDCVAGRPEEVPESRVCELRLGFACAGEDYSVSAIDSVFHPELPKGGLADAGFSFDQQDRGPAWDLVEKLGDMLLLLLPAKDRYPADGLNHRGTGMGCPRYRGQRPRPGCGSCLPIDRPTYLPVAFLPGRPALSAANRGG
jgi:hypothetical protein